MAVVAGVAWLLWPRATDFERAAAMLPAETLRVTWTDWDSVRDEVGAEVGPDDMADELADRDLAVSSLLSSAERLEAGIGFSPVDAQWEIMGQSRDGLVVILSFDDVASVADGFAAAGWPRPGDDAMDGAVWQGSATTVNDLGLTTFELTNVAFLADQGLLLASDQAPYLESAVRVARGDADGLDLSGLTAGAEPLVATAFAGDFACEALSMSSADDEARAVAASLVEQAGGVSPLTGYLVALEPGSRIRIVFGFEDDDRAERNLAPRRALAGADDPGQGVDYRSLFTLADAEADGHHVVLTGQADDRSYPLSNLTSGPVLLAAC
ncbi:hypothetical protein [Nocardioides sp. AE5]|uniref:hypothetical protein n=1 Tax=Nocardioides sp. AE5 TaxID=2962573 RepID=UPI002882D3AA|nr:hypothetical protein [Nocardioides sp. AE5]MDT0202545.1 hypothetical protein [Nocardioides sp. AE5]